MSHHSPITLFPSPPRTMSASTAPFQLIRRIQCRQSAVRAVRFNSDGLYCLTAGGDKSVKLWNPYTCKLLKTYVGHSGEVLDVRANADNSRLGSGGADCLVLLWDVATGASVRRWRRHAGKVNVVRFADPILSKRSSDLAEPSPLLLSGSLDGSVLVWDARARTPYPVQTMHEAKDSITCIDFNRWYIVTGSLDRCTRIYDIRKGEMVEDYVGYPITSVSMTFDCQCLLVGCQDSTLRLFDAINGELLNTYSGHTNKEYKMDSVLLNSDAKIASGSEQGNSVLVWDFVQSDSQPIRLDHSPGGYAWDRLSSDVECHEVDRLLVDAAQASSNFMIHSLSGHPRESKLLTAGSDFIWLWDGESTTLEAVEQ